MKKCQYICESTHKQCKRNASREVRNKFVCRQHFNVILPDAQLVNRRKKVACALKNKKSKKSPCNRCNPELANALQQLLGPYAVKRIDDKKFIKK